MEKGRGKNCDYQETCTAQKLKNSTEMVIGLNFFVKFYKGNGIFISWRITGTKTHHRRITLLGFSEYRLFLRSSELTALPKKSAAFYHEVSL